MKILKSDNMLKIISVFFAIILWLYVVQVESPDVEKTFKGVSVVFTQKSVLEEKGLTILNDKDRTIDVKLRGNRKHMIDVSAENITVLADVSAIEETGIHTVYTSVVLPYGNLEVINKNPTGLKVEVDSLISETFNVNVTPTGTPKSGFVPGELHSSPEKIDITGAKSILDGIHSVSAEIDINNASTDAATVSQLKIYDSNNKEIDSSYIKFSSSEVQLGCEILKTKTVSIVPELSDKLSDSELYAPDTNSLSKVNVKGAASVIDKLSFIKTKPITLDDIDESGNATVVLDLPDGVYSSDGDSFIIRFVKKHRD